MIDDSGLHWMKIFMYVPETNTSLSIDKVTAFYTAVSCGIANWTASKINSLVSLSPLLFEPHFPDHDGYPLRFENIFQEYFYKFEQIVQTYTKSFVIVINNLIKTHRKASYHKNTSVLETLISLQISFECL